MKIKDLTGQRFGLLVAQYRVENIKPVKWHCRCDCGAEVDVYSSNLVRGLTRSCGAPNHRTSTCPTHSAKWEDITGQRFGKLVALSYDKARHRWLCKCDCGETCYCNVTELRTFRRDCGCLAAEAAAERLKAGVAGFRQGTNINRIQNTLKGKTSEANRSGITGVRRRDNTTGVSYNAYITVHRKTIYLGTYPSIESAQQARIDG